MNPSSDSLNRFHRRQRRRFKSDVEPRQQRLAAATIVVFVVVVLLAMSSSMGTGASENANEKIEVLRREKARFASIRTEEPIRIENPPQFRSLHNFGRCEIEPAQVPDHRIQSTFTASYPGSGAKMTWKLIEAMTGLVTGDDFQLNGHENIVSIKTHYPSSEGRPLPGAEEITRAMLLIRNPLYSIPSYFNFLYEYKNGLPGHSTRAPLHEWIVWRDANFDNQLEVWRRHAEYWMDTYSRGPNRLIIQYERLISDDYGPDMAIQIGQFLNRSDGVKSKHLNEIPCIWHTIVKYKEHQKQNNVRRRLEEAPQAGVDADPQSKRGGPKYIAPFTREQLRTTMNVLTTLLERFKNDEPVMTNILIQYIDEVARRAEGPPEDENTIITEG